MLQCLVILHKWHVANGTSSRVQFKALWTSFSLLCLSYYFSYYSTLFNHQSLASCLSSSSSPLTMDDDNLCVEVTAPGVRRKPHSGSLIRWVHKYILPDALKIRCKIFCTRYWVHPPHVNIFDLTLMLFLFKKYDTVKQACFIINVEWQKYAYNGMYTQQIYAWTALTR